MDKSLGEQPKVNIEHLNADEKAKLLKELQGEKDAAFQEMKNLAESPALRTNIYDEKSGSRQNLEAVAPVDIASPKQESSVRQNEAQTGKKILNRFLAGKESFEDVKVNEENAVDMVDAATEREEEG